jgi:hypothetical protein
VRHIDPAGAQFRLAGGAPRGAVEIRCRAEEQRATVLAAEHAGEHAGADRQFLQDLAAFPEAQDPAGERVGDPQRSLGVQAAPVRADF